MISRKRKQFGLLIEQTVLNVNELAHCQWRLLISSSSTQCYVPVTTALQRLRQQDHSVQGHPELCIETLYLPGRESLQLVKFGMTLLNYISSSVQSWLGKYVIMELEQCVCYMNHYEEPVWLSCRQPVSVSLVPSICVDCLTINNL